MTIKKPRASEDVLGALHEAVTKMLLEKVLSGEANHHDVTAALKLLKDNKIDCVIEPGSNLEKLAYSLPTFDDIEDEVGQPITKGQH